MGRTYSVEGMTCQGCANAVTKAITQLAPEATVKVDLPGKQVTVAGLDDDKAVAEAVEAAGFDYKGLA